MKELNLIYFAAQELPPADRPAYLTKACAGDHELRTRVEQMLAIASRAESFFAADLAEDGSEGRKPGRGPAKTIKLDLDDVPDEVIGQKIGRYKILERVGEGGCGVVYVAEQTDPVRRRVALKVIKLGMDTKQVVARFEAERQALAMMDHPNIAKVLDGGSTEQGRPYFIMELVRGIKITDYCDQANLPTKDRLNLFIQVCHAIQHAHQKGIIHRDIKPSNILVTLNDGMPVPKVIDFGIAKATEGRLTDATVYTQLNQFIGTPAYMSPEQAEMSSLDIDTRSDIYSLGILLYELLAGSTPFDTQELMSMGIDAMRKTIREKEPVRPSTRLATLQGDELSTAAKRRAVEAPKLIHQLKGDLDWIVMRCLEKDRSRRYESASGLAADIKRHLNTEPVVARPPSKLYEFQKTVRRHKFGFAATAAIIIVLAMGIAASVDQAVRAKSAEQRALATLDELRASAPAFAEQAHALAANERFDEAIEKLDYAVKLRPDVADYLLAKGDLLQSQFKLAEAATIYREALRVQPGLARAEASARLCDELLAAKPDANGKLTRESLAKLHLAMQRQQRPAAELMPVARLLGDENKFLVAYWLEQLKDLPISAENPLAQRLAVRDDGLLALDLSGTQIADLAPLTGMPLGALNLNGCSRLTNFAQLAEFRHLTKLWLRNTPINNLSPLQGLPLDELNLSETPVSDLSPLRRAKLRILVMWNSQVNDLTPLAGMPLQDFNCGSIPATDFSPLAGAPLEHCILDSTPVRDLSFLKGSPVKELSLIGCGSARGLAVIASSKSLERLILPSDIWTFPDEELTAIRTLRTRPALEIKIQEWQAAGLVTLDANSRSNFWQDWDRDAGFIARLRQSGVAIKSLSRSPDGTWELDLGGQPISDLKILSGVPINSLALNDSAVSDLSPLRGMPIKALTLNRTKVTDLGPLQGMRIERLEIVSTMVTNLAALRGMPMTTLHIGDTPVASLEPLRGMPLTSLVIYDTRVTDLSPLAGMPLQRFHLGGTKVKDLSVVRGMPLTYLRLHSCSELTDISPLADCKDLQSLTLPPNATNIECLRALPKLERISFVEDQTSYEPDKTAAEFWQDDDVKKLAESKRP